jgi:hypothetical protein
VKRRMKKTTKQYITVAAICLTVIGGIAIVLCLYVYTHLNKEFGTKYKLAMEELAANQKELYVTTNDIAMGEYILKDNIEYKKVFSTQPEETYFTSDDIGKMAIVEIKAGTHLLSTMVSENLVDTDLRETTYNVITVNTNITHNDMVDIRILYPNGENYIVLSKKYIKFFNESKEDSYLWLSEEEILRMSSAIVDAYLYNGTVLYTTRYVEPNVQSESIITYTPSLISIELIQNSPNIVTIASGSLNQEVRKKIENRLAKVSVLDISNINWDVKDKVTSEQDDNAVADKSNKQTVDADGFAYYTSEFDNEEKEIEFGE